MTNSAVNPPTLNNGTLARGSDIFQILLADENGQSILSIDDGAQRQSLRVIIVNTSGQTISLKSLEEPLSATNYHFRIAFRPGTLVNQGEGVTLTVEDEQGKKIEGWQIQQTDNTFYLGYLGLNESAAKSIAIGKRLTFVLGNIGATPAGGSRGTRVEVQFDRLGYAGSDAVIGGTRLQYLNIVNHRGKKQIPLYAGFLGSNTILNDGSENELTLSIQMLPQASTPLRIQDSSAIPVPSQKPPIDYTTLTGREKNVFDAIAKKLEIIPDVLANSLTISHSVADIPNTTRLPDAMRSLLGQESDQSLSVVSEVDLQIIRSFILDLRLRETEPYKSILNNLKVISHDPERTNSQSLNLPKIETIESFDEAVKFTISFDVATTQDESRHWALVEKTNADDIQIAIAQGQENWVFGGKFEQGITPQWSFICKQSLKLTDRQEILRLSIRNLKTQLLSGYANLYVHYENFPGYWDGFITVPIHKGPLVYRECEDASKAKIGCVGIGTDEPQAKLHVKSSTGVVGLRVEGDAAITGNLSTAKVGVGTAPGTEQLKVQGDAAIAGKLSVSNTSTLTGKVGIGTAPGTEQLKVQGDAAIAGDVVVTNGRVGIGTTTNLDKEPLVIRAQGTQQGLIAFEDPDGVKKWHIEQNYGGNKPGLNFVETNVADFRLFLQAGGNVGIGTHSPRAKLEIQQTRGSEGFRLLQDGNTERSFRIGFEDNGTIHFYHDGPTYSSKGQYMPTDGGWHQNSDISLKTDISSLQNVLEQIVKLNPVRFAWKDCGSRDIGFIAQEVENVLPELVSSVNLNDVPIKGICYEKFAVLAIRAVQELKQYYDELALENQVLQRRLEELESNR